jgi:hypothetical protein
MAIIHGSKEIPLELIEYHYRKLFGLSYREMSEEPIDAIRINLYIEKLLKLREERENEKIKEKKKSGRKRTKI